MTAAHGEYQGRSFGNLTGLDNDKQPHLKYVCSGKSQPWQWLISESSIFDSFSDSENHIDYTLHYHMETHVLMIQTGQHVPHKSI